MNWQSDPTPEARPLVDTLVGAPFGKAEPVTVGALAVMVKGTLEHGFGRVQVVGEVTNAKLHGSGHFYFDLKDDSAVLNAVAWRSAVARWNGRPETGQLVVASGRLTTYPARSQYQLQVDRVELAGVGALLQQLEVLRAKLAAEGLFDEARKRPLPLLPARIGLITSPTGAVVQDVLQRIAARCPRQVLVWPVTVQGPTTAGEVAAAIAGFNAMPDGERPDVLIVARGGGSVEDLWAFNSEVLVRAVAGSGIVVISGVGHEPDVTLCDFAADVRAATPTAAAELAVPVRLDWLAELADTRERLARTMQQQVAQRRLRVQHLARLVPDPRRMVLQAGLRMQELTERLRAVAPRVVGQRRLMLQSLTRVLGGLDPTAVLGRGFVFLTNAQGEVLPRATAPSGPVQVHFADGTRDGVLT